MRYDTRLIPRVVEALPRDTDDFAPKFEFFPCRERISAQGNQTFVTSASRFSLPSPIAPDFVQHRQSTARSEEILPIQGHWNADLPSFLDKRGHFFEQK
jgi:hypothetical protein